MVDLMVDSLAGWLIVYLDARMAEMRAVMKVRKTAGLMAEWWDV